MAWHAKIMARWRGISASAASAKTWRQNGGHRQSIVALKIEKQAWHQRSMAYEKASAHRRGGAATSNGGAHQISAARALASRQ